MVPPTLFIIVIFSFHPAVAKMEVERYSVVTSVRCMNATALAYRYQGINKTRIIVCPKNMPFCDRTQRSCVPTKPLPPFICPANDGNFPQINGCEGFMICQKKVAYKFDCIKGHLYHFGSQKCISKERTACHTFPCRSKTAIMVAHTGDSRLYALCENGQAVSLNQCPVGWLFDEKLQYCAVACVGEGVFQDTKDKKKYYKCISSPEAYRLLVFYCPDKQLYDPIRDMCLLEPEKKNNQAEGKTKDDPEKKTKSAPKKIEEVNKEANNATSSRP